MDDDQDFPVDPASLLPFVCVLMPANPNAVQIANSEKFIGEKAGGIELSTDDDVDRRVD